MSLHFDLAVTEIPVELGERKYVLREASEGAACQFRNAITKAAKMADGKVVGIENIGDVEPLLVSLCLFEVLPDGGTKNIGVPIQVVRGWPARVVKQLFAKAKEISELDEAAETEEAIEQQIARLQERLNAMRLPKNAQSATPDTSA